tara:strand:+ start:1848 stop:2375 length:528 start_codon:yes stop_codon:yes gene_type:complete
MKSRFLFIILLMCSLQAKQIEISIADQKLYLYDSGELVKEYIISSSKYGEGSEDGSFKTPLGKHKISKMIGGDQPHGMRFIGRIPSEIYPIYSEEKVFVTDDVVQSRIIWLTGLEEGINSGSGIDSYARYIYIHGTPEEWLLGEKASKGCIRMSNSDVIELFNQLEGNESVQINK